MRNYPVNYDGSVNLNNLSLSQCVELRNDLMNAINENHEFEQFQAHRKRNLQIVNTWLKYRYCFN